MLDARCPGEAAPRSLAESALDELLAQTDLPAPSCEYPLPGGPPGTQFVDRAWAQVRLILEVDGRTWHSRERDMAKDRARDRAAARLGWQTIRVLAQEVFSLPDLVRDDVVAIHDARRLELLRP